MQGGTHRVGGEQLAENLLALVLRLPLHHSVLSQCTDK